MFFLRPRLRDDCHWCGRRRRDKLPSRLFAVHHFGAGLQSELLFDLAGRSTVRIRSQLLDAGRYVTGNEIAFDDCGLRRRCRRDDLRLRRIVRLQLLHDHRNERGTADLRGLLLHDTFVPAESAKRLVYIKKDWV